MGFEMKKKVYNPNWVKDLIKKGKEKWYKENHNKKLIETCKKCEKHISYDEERKIVFCGRIEGKKVVVFVMPSNWNKGIENGKLVIDCKGDI